jgi:hypothetical protein
VQEIYCMKSGWGGSGGRLVILGGPLFLTCDITGTVLPWETDQVLFLPALRGQTRPV